MTVPGTASPAGTWIVIPAHNRCATTLGCLRQLRFNGDLLSFSVIVVDDGSTDGTTAAVSREFPEVTVLTGDGQLWWTGAIRVGMQHGFEHGAQAIIWLNDDCQPQPGALPILAALALRDGCTVAGPSCLREDGTSVPTGFVGGQTINVNPSEEKIVDGLSGYCVVVPRPAWERLGPPDGKRFPHYYGDTAYTLAAKRAGLPVVLTSCAQVVLPGHALMPASPADLRNPALGWRENWRQIFDSPKSPFRLATQWHYLRLKYGCVTGSALAVARTASWILQFALAGRR